MTFTQAAQRRLEDHPFDKDDPLVVQLRIPDVPTYDSLHKSKRSDVSASVVFYFDEGEYKRGVTANYQFNADTTPNDATRPINGRCSLCYSGQEPHFDCEVWFRSAEPKKRKFLCEDCLESFLEIRDELLEECSGQIASEEL